MASISAGWSRSIEIHRSSHSPTALCTLTRAHRQRGKGEKSKNESSPLRIDPKWSATSHFTRIAGPQQNLASKMLLEHYSNPSCTKNDDLSARLLHGVQEAAEHDMKGVKKSDEGFNTTLIFVSCLSCPLIHNFTHSRTPVCFLALARLSSSVFTPSSNSTQPSFDQRVSQWCFRSLSSPVALVGTIFPHPSLRNLSPGMNRPGF